MASETAHGRIERRRASAPDLAHSARTRRPKQIIQDFACVVDAQFYGHIHRFGYMASDSLPPLFLGGPVTRISHTAPDFTLMPFRGTQGSVVDDRVQWTFFNATQTWEPHASLRGVLGLSTLSPAALVNASVAMLRGNASTFDRFYTLFEGGFATHSPSALGQLAVSCFSLAFDWTDAFRECLGSVLGGFWGSGL